MVKTMGSVLPRADRPVEDSEYHYSRIHQTFVRRMIRQHDERVVWYYSDLALAQYSLAGRFDQKPEAWRITALDYRDDDWKTSWAPPVAAAARWRDHANCLGEFGHSCVVEPSVVADLLSKQTCLQKYVIEHARNTLSRSDAETHYDEEVAVKLLGMIQGAYGFRLWVTNRVVGEFEMGTNDEGVEVLLPSLRESDLIAYDEIYFDNALWAEEFFARQDVFEVLQFGPLLSPTLMVRHDGLIDRR